MTDPRLPSYFSDSIDWEGWVENKIRGMFNAGDNPKRANRCGQRAILGVLLLLLQEVRALRKDLREKAPGEGQ